MLSKRRILLAVMAAALLAATPAGLPAQNALPAEGNEADLIAVLESPDSPVFERAKACQTLAVIGTKRCVPVLAGLLSDEKLAHYARFGLEPIADPSVDDALRAAMGKLQGMMLVGVIDSIGMRRDAKAVEGLKKLLGSPDRQVAAAAAAALGRIATPESVEALKKALGGAAELRPAVGDACLTACDVLLAAGKRDEAAALCDAVLAGRVPKHVRIAAAHGAIRARGAAAVPRLVEYLQSDDKALFRVGLRMAYDLPAKQVTEALVAELAKIKPAPEEAARMLTIVKAEYGAGEKWVDVADALRAAIRDNELSVTAGNGLAGDPAPGTVKTLRLVYKLGDKQSTVEAAEKEVIELRGDKLTRHPRQVLLISVLGDLGDKSALPPVLAAAEAGAYDVRVAAVRALAGVGDARAVPVLLKTAVEGQGELAPAALASAAKLKGKEVDAAVAAALEGTHGRDRAVVIDLVGRRGITSAVPVLLETLDSEDDQVRREAIGALGVTVGLDKLDTLIGLLLKPKSPDDAGPVGDALKRACLRMPDRDATAARLVAAMPRASAETASTLLDLLGWVGGEKALKAVAAAAREGDEATQDAATEVLGRWMSPDAAPVLLDLAKTLQSNKFKIRALRGHVRIARQLKLSDDQRVAMCRDALAAAWRDQEKKLVLEVLTRNPSADALSLALTELDSPTLKEDAGTAAVTIAQKILDKQPAAVATAMEKVLQSGVTGDAAKKAKGLLNRAKKGGR